MRFFSYFADAGKTIMTNKMRSGLSTLGIVIGMLSVIVMMAIGQGAESAMMKNMGDMMKNKIAISPDGGYNRRDEKNDKPGAFVQKVRFTRQIISYIEGYFPILSGKITYQIRAADGEVKVGSKKENASVLGVPQNWFTLNEKKVVEGGGLQHTHYKNLGFVAVINNYLKEKLFKNKSPLGKKLRVDKKEYTIVGVLEKSEFERGGQLFVPDTTVMQRIKHNDTLDQFEIFLDPKENNALRQQRLSYLLLKKFNQPNKASAGFNVYSEAKWAEKMKSSSNMFKYLLLAIGAISLLVGGIGVMNIMIVSVTERTREIGIRKAIGALNNDIIMQFLVESVVITLIGGLIAFGLSYVVIYFINKALSGGEMGEIKAIIDMKVAVIAFGITAFTGIIFGILPARKAAKLKPIDALRFE